MARSNSTRKLLQVAIYWGGAEIGRYSRPLHRSRGVTAGKKFFCDIKSIIWPRWDELEIIVNTKSGLILNPNLPWDGVFQNKHQKLILNSTKLSKSLLEIDNQTSASLRLDEMSIAIRVGTPFVTTTSHSQLLQGYRASALDLWVSNPVEYKSTTVAALAATLLFGSVFSTLKSRKNDDYTSFASLQSDYLLPFISQSYLANAPALIQGGLDRHNYVKSVWNYFADFTDVIGYGGVPQSDKSLFESTVNEYKLLARSQANTLESARRVQVTQTQSLSPQNSIISVPTVRGESLDGKIMRVLDKISTVASVNSDLASRRIAAAESFEKDIGYTYDSSKDGAATNEAFEKLAQGFTGVGNDLDLQRDQARTIAAKAAVTQIELFGSDRLKFGPIGCCALPLGAPLTQTGFTWLSPQDLRSSEISLAALKASTWGAPVHNSPKIMEPLGGKIAPSIVERIVTAGKFQLRLCYELSLRRNQASRGSMEWKWQIDSRGQISNIDLLNTNIKDEELIRCVRDKIATWKFPKPTGGSVEVKYPFEFSKDKG